MPNNCYFLNFILLLSPSELQEDKDKKKEGKVDEQKKIEGKVFTRYYLENFFKGEYEDADDEVKELFKMVYVKVCMEHCNYIRIKLDRGCDINLGLYLKEFSVSDAAYAMQVVEVQGWYVAGLFRGPKKKESKEDYLHAIEEMQTSKEDGETEEKNRDDGEEDSTKSQEEDEEEDKEKDQCSDPEDTGGSEVHGKGSEQDDEGGTSIGEESSGDGVGDKNRRRRYLYFPRLFLSSVIVFQFA